MMNSLLLVAGTLATINVETIAEPVSSVKYQQAIAPIVASTGFNGSVIISKNGELLLNRHFGFFDKDKTRPITGKHLYSPGSVGKEFTTVSMLKLIAQGKLGLTDHVSQYLDGLPEWAKDINIEQLLSHRSGLPKVKWKKSIATADVIEQLSNATPAFSPGEGYLYSNVNVVLRALVIEQITKMPYANLLQHSIFDVAKMGSAYQQITPENVSTHVVPGDYLTFLNGVTIYLTPLDLLKFETSLWNNSLLDSEQIKMALPGGERFSGKPNRAYFDFGNFYPNEDGELAVWEHDGSNPSHHTLKYHDFESQLILILMSNDGNKSTLYKIRDAVIAL